MVTFGNTYVFLGSTFIVKYNINYIGSYKIIISLTTTLKTSTMQHMQTQDIILFVSINSIDLFCEMRKFI